MCQQSLRLEPEGGGERVDELRETPPTCRPAMSAKSLAQMRAPAQRAVQVERRDRAPRPRPGPVTPGEQDDRPVVALDEPRRDDPDHTFVPVLAPDDVCLAAALGLGPFLDLRDRRTQDGVLD